MTETPRLLGGRYELAGPLGRGGMAQVVRAKDTRLGRDVAIKQLRIDLAVDPTFQARFRREAQAAAGLNHPNIVAVYDTGEEPDPATGISVPYIVMELVEGHTLRDLLRDGRKILPSRALEFTQGVLEALSYSHKAGIVHRDIKPANVMLTSTGMVKVMDFGIARAVADTSATMTQTAAVIGTAQYLSPEQARGETVDARSDIYSAGCMLYELLVGKPPFQGDSPVSVAYQHVREAPVPPSQLDPMITTSMDAIVLKALAKDAAHRYQTAAAMRADIGRLLAGQDVSASMPVVVPAAPTQVMASSPLTAAAAMPPAGAGDTMPQRALPSREVEQKPRRGWLWGLIAFLVVVVAGVGTALVLNPGALTREVAVPSVSELQQITAEEKIRADGLVPVVKTVVGPDDTTVGRVTKQDPVAGQQVKVGSTVTIQVNIGPKKATIPANLLGMDLDDVQKELKDLGFTNVRAEVAATEPSSAKPDEVLDLQPVSGASIALDARITIYYAAGTGSVPNFFNMTKAAATAYAEQNGFKVKFTEQESTEPPGRVISQDPAVGEVIKRTKVITLVLAKEVIEPTVSSSPSPSPSPSKGDD
ncbi:MAG: Stk1 family PASTA domain-containing Ser/Thr kinase [Micropruina sp.]